MIDLSTSTKIGLLHRHNKGFLEKHVRSLKREAKRLSNKQTLITTNHTLLSDALCVESKVGCSQNQKLEDAHVRVYVLRVRCTSADVVIAKLPLRPFGPLQSSVEPRDMQKTSRAAAALLAPAGGEILNKGYRHIYTEKYQESMALSIETFVYILKHTHTHTHKSTAQGCTCSETHGSPTLQGNTSASAPTTHRRSPERCVT